MIKLCVLMVVLLVLLVGVGVVFVIKMVDVVLVCVEVLCVVEDFYIYGVFNEQNIDVMCEGFYLVFKIYGVCDGELSMYLIDEWMSNIDKCKVKVGYQQEIWEYCFLMVDIMGGVVVVKVELFKVENGVLMYVFIDYFLLLQFVDGWKIIDKVYYCY